MKKNQKHEILSSFPLRALTEPGNAECDLIKISLLQLDNSCQYPEASTDLLAISIQDLERSPSENVCLK
jgi:hypothetical protein